MSFFQRLAPWLLSGCLPGCVALPDVPAGVCGNGVVEPDKGEQCDLYADKGQHCGLPTESNEKRRCHYLCKSNLECPEDKQMSCGTDGICHLGSERYVEWRKPIAHQAHALRLGDLDGDGRADLLALGTPDLSADWQSQPTIMFFDESGVQAGQAFDLQTRIRSPTLAPIVKAYQTPRPQQQLVMGTSFGIATLLANSERKFFSLPYPFQTLPADTQYRMIPVRGVTETYANATVLIYLSSGDNSVLLDGGTGKVLGSLAHPVSDLSGDPTAARLDGTSSVSPCDEIFYALKSSGDVYALRFCDTSGNLLEGNLDWRIAASLPGGKFVGSRPDALGVMLADLNGDKRLDMLVADQNACPYVAFGQSDGTFSAAPAAPAALWPVATQSTTCPGVPLAVGDLSESAWPDWVMPDGVRFVTSLVPNAALSRIELTSVLGKSQSKPPWTAARIAHLTDDSHWDLVAGSKDSAGLDVWIGAGNGLFNSTVLHTDGRVLKLVTGDYNGDVIDDIAFVHDHTSDPNRPYGLAVAYSRSQGEPSPPTEIAALPKVEQLTTGDYQTDDAIQEIGVLTKTSDGAATELTLFVGNFGQCPVSSLGLWRPDSSSGQTAADSVNMIRGGPPVALAAGHFADKEKMSFLALASDDCSGENCSSAYRLWLAPDAELGDLDQPSEQIAQLGYLTAATEPASFFVVGNLDGDSGGRDDALLLTPGPNENQVSLWRVDPSLDGAPLTHLSSTDGRLMPNSSPILADLDGDRRLDLVLMLRGATNDQERLLVFWNEKGTLGPENSLQIKLPDDKQVRGFAKREDPEVAGLFIVSDDGVYTMMRDPTATSARDLPPITAVSLDTTSGGPISGASAIAVGDMTGDGLADLALGDNGSIRVFKQLEQVAP